MGTPRTNRKKHKSACLMCGVGFLAARPDATSCSAAHRVALARFVKKHGRRPHFPPFKSIALAAGGFYQNRSSALKPKK